MKFANARGALFAVVLVSALGLAGCGGGGSTAPVTSEHPVDPDPPKVVEPPVTVALQSDAGDYIGGGRAYNFTQANSRIAVTFTNGLLHIDVRADAQWTGDFLLQGAPAQLVPANLKDVGRYPFAGAGNGALDWGGDGRGCNTLVGSFTVSNVVYTGATLHAFDLAFEQHCEGAAPALHGQVHWNSTDPTQPPPVDPALPPGLWSPPANAIPATGRSIYLQSDAGDYIGAGQTYLYTQSNALLSIDGSGGHVAFGVNGDQSWNADFTAMANAAQLQKGYYGGAQRFPFNNPTVPGMSWYGNGRGCNTLTGWFVVDDVTYTNGTLASIKIRFEQHCEGNTAALHGQITWTATDDTAPAGPPAPSADLWKPDPSAVPASGNFVYLQSDAGDYIGAGRSYLYTTGFSASATGALFNVDVNNADSWTGDFAGMSSQSRLQPGYYGNLQRYPFNNPLAGGLTWYGNGRGCNRLSGWFVVDSVNYTNGTLTAIQLRFEQHCEGNTPALRGAIRWTAP